jgi:cleavage and polyadenylation specificity factor subunit 2
MSWFRFQVILASTPDLEFGYARELFMQWCQDKKNCVILTTRPGPGTLGRFLIENPQPGIIELEVRKKVELKGRELEDYYRQQREMEYKVKKEKM